MTRKEQNKKRIVQQQDRKSDGARKTLATALFEKPLQDVLTTNKGECEQAKLICVGDRNACVGSTRTESVPDRVTILNE